MPVIFVRVLLLAGILSVACWCIADDNLLGLPAPRDPEHLGAVMLHGGGTITGDAFERFIELAGGEQARIILVPSAGYSAGDYESQMHFLDVVTSRYSSWVDLASQGRIRSFQFLYTDNPLDADNPQFIKPLETATGVWFSGGLQGRLNYRFVGRFPQQTRFQTALRAVVERGGVVGGTSAGMAALPEVMTLTQNRPFIDATATAVPAHGLGLFNRAIVEQHFDARSGRLERFTGLLRNSEKLDALTGRNGAGSQMLGLAVEERTALLVRGDQLEVLGTGHTHVFLKSQAGRTITWHLLGPGDTAQLKREIPGNAQLQRDEVVLSR